jgi:hypothetical protein
MSDVRPQPNRIMRKKNAATRRKDARPLISDHLARIGSSCGGKHAVEASRFGLVPPSFPLIGTSPDPHIQVPAPPASSSDE